MKQISMFDHLIRKQEKYKVVHQTVLALQKSIVVTISYIGQRKKNPLRENQLWKWKQGTKFLRAAC